MSLWVWPLPWGGCSRSGLPARRLSPFQFKDFHLAGLQLNGSLAFCTPIPHPNLDLMLACFRVFYRVLIAAVLFGEFKFEGFQTENKLGHYLSGAILMGFGAVLAGGCTVGAGMSGGVVFSNTAWLTLVSIIAGAAMTYKFLKSIGAPT